MTTVLARHARRVLRRALTTWLAIELGGGVLALAVTVAVAPWVVVLLSVPARPWMATAAVLSVSVPVSVLLGASTLKLSRDLLAQARIR